MHFAPNTVAAVSYTHLDVYKRQDTVRGSCRKEDCVFILRKEIRRFADSLSNLDLDGGKRTSDDE